MESVVIFASGLFVGALITMMLLKIFHAGILNVDLSDIEDGPYLFLELNKDINAIMKKKRIILTVKLKLKRYISQK